MLKNEKRGQTGVIPALLIILGSLAVVSAFVANSSNETLNLTEINITTNETIISNVSLSNSSAINDTPLSNESSNISIENITSLNQSIINETINTNISLDLTNLSLPEKPIKNLSQIIEKNKDKLNNETEDYLKNIKDKKESRKYIVKFRNSIDENKLVNVNLGRKFDRFKAAKIEGKAEDIEDLIEDDEIEFIELEQDVKVLGDNIPFNVIKTNANSVWNLTNGSGVKVAVLDTGIALHDDLSVAGGVSFVDGNYYDSNGHGTAVAGVIGALLNNEGLAGIAPAVSLYSIKIMQSSTGELSNAIAGIEWAIDNNMDIVSMSFGFDGYSQIFKEVLQEAYANNILLVAASGNGGTGNILYPAKYDSVIAAGAIDSNDNLASFSSYGFEQELAAPGVDINSTSLGNGYSVLSGTSLAAPHVAGVAALIKAYNKSLTNEQIRAKLRNDALDLGNAGRDDFYGYGMVQVNLTTANYTLINLSYFYEIFNISNFRLPNETYLFWVNGTGTIDDVNFLPGYYLVNMTFGDGRKKSDIYNVTENGSIFILSTDLVWTDGFQPLEGGSYTDGVAWLNDGITVKIDSTLSTIEAECYFVGNPMPLNTFDYCFFDSSAHQTECNDGDPDILCDSTHTDCSVVSQMEAERSIISHNFAHTNTSQARAYPDCTTPGVVENTQTKTYYVIEKKSARCTNSTHYNLSGWYGTNWIKYADDTCTGNTVCVTTGNYTAENTYVDPCISQNTCTGTIQVITEDRNGNPMSNLSVSRDGISNKTTDSVGVAEYNLSKTCFEDMTFTVRCSNTSGAQICGSKTTELSTINSYEGLLFDCSICSGTPDIQIDVDNVRTNKAKSNVTVNISLVSSFSATNVNATFKVQGDDGLIKREASQLFNINSGSSFVFINQTIAMNDNDDFLHVYVDTNNGVQESNEKNNYALIPLFEKQIDVYFDISTGYPSVDSEIKKYVKLFVNEESTQANADVTLCVGRKCSNFGSLNSFTTGSILKSQKFGYKNNKIVFEGKDVGTNKPYNGIVGGFWNDLGGKNYIMAYGIDVDGDIAAVKKLISARELFLNIDLLFHDRTKVIDDYDLTGLAVNDLLRTNSSKPYYTQRGSDAFANVISRILNNNNFEIAVKTVQTLNTTSYGQSTILRLKNVNTDYSENYKEAITNGTKPVIMSAGLFSTLTEWEGNGKGLARNLVDDGHDVWEIEMNGYENTECSTCPDYTYQDQVDYFWPVLIAGVLNYSGKSQAHYIGQSNGCRVALSSLNSYSNGKNGAGYSLSTTTGLYDINISLPNRPIDKFFGVGCPAILNEGTIFTNTIRYNNSQQAAGNLAMRDINQSSLNHVRLNDYANFLARYAPSLILDFIRLGGWALNENNRISRNLMQFYNDLGISTTSTYAISKVNVSEIYLYNGRLTLVGSDGVVPFSDQATILNNVTIPVEEGTSIFFTTHIGIKNENKLKNNIRGELKK